jgi:hypothetical protein
MTLFEYVSVMVAVVLALGVAQILNGIGALLVARERPETYWIHSVWIAFVALLHITIWWYFWDLRLRPPDTVPAFVFSLLGPAVVYLTTYVLLDGRFPQNAREHFYRVRRPLFALSLAGTAIQLLAPWVQDYPVPISFTAGSLLSIGVAAAGFATANPRAQGGIAVYFLIYTVLNLVARFEVGAFTPS